MSTVDERLVSEIYEAAFTPSHWQTVLHGLARRVGAAGTLLFTLQNKDVARWTASEGIQKLVEDWMAGGWQGRTQRAPRMLAKRHPGFVVDLDVFTREELDQQADQIEFLRPRGFGWGAGSFIEMPNGDVAIYSIERHFHAGPLTRADVAVLDSLRPHLARSALLATRLGLEKVRSAVSMLEIVGLAAAVIGPTGRTIAANGLFDGVSDQVSIGAYNQLRLREAAANDMLLDRISRGRSGRPMQACSIPLRATETSPAAVAHVLPVCGVAQDVFSRASSVVIITPAKATSRLDIGILQALFDLTPSEAKVSKAIVDGRTVREIADGSDLSFNTVRTQVKTAMAKLGVSRQADVVSLLSGLSLTRSAG
jgi:DNA-binding CsgD family transcriptional regulator